jgi:hypothetical protein
VDNCLFASSKDQSEVDEDLLTDLDARVLQSLLQDSTNKLDLQQEENMKKLLERGIKSKQKVESPIKRKEDEPSDYSSKVIKTLANTKLWRALTRNAQDFVESAKIAIANRVERDAKLITSLGIFALDRALQDVSRALPSATSFAKKQNMFQLSDKSSYQASNESSDKMVDLRKEFSTPQDEIKIVTAEIKEILERADQQVTQRSPSSVNAKLTSSASSLKSTARRGTARLSQAYQRQQKTKLAREKENIAQKAPRLVTNVIDSAYQVKRELQIEPNQPGYKTKRLREATATTAKLLASAARAGASSFLLKQDEKKKGSNQLPSSVETAASSLSGIAPPRPPMEVDVVVPPLSTDGESKTQRDTAPDASTMRTSAAYSASQTSNDDSSSPSIFVTSDPVDFLDGEPYFAFKRGPKPSYTERRTLTPSQILQDQMQTFTTDPETSYVYDQVNQDAPEMVSTVAESTTQLDVITAEILKSTDGVIEGIDPGTIDAFAIVGDNTELESPGDYLFTGYGYAEDATALKDEDLRHLRQVTAEVISEEDFESVFGQAKAVDNLGEFDGDDDTEEEQPNLLVLLTLRSLDVVFLVVEKAVLLIPDLLALTTRVTTRVGEINREGMGQIGWEPLNTKIRGSKRY